MHLTSKAMLSNFRALKSPHTHPTRIWKKTGFSDSEIYLLFF